MEAIDNNRFFSVSQWKSCSRYGLLCIFFVHSHLQFASGSTPHGPLVYG